MRTILASVIWGFVFTSRALGGNITIDFADFPPDLPPGSAVGAYSTQGYTFYAEGAGISYLYQVASNDPYWYGVNALAFLGPEYVVMTRTDGLDFSLYGISFGTGSQGNPVPLSILISGAFQPYTAVVTTSGAFQSFTPTITDVSSITFIATDGMGNPESAQFTDLVVPFVAPEPTSFSLALIGIGMTVVSNRRLREVKPKASAAIL